MAVGQMTLVTLNTYEHSFNNIFGAIPKEREKKKAAMKETYSRSV